MPFDVTTPGFSCKDSSMAVPSAATGQRSLREDFGVYRYRSPLLSPTPLAEGRVRSYAEVVSSDPPLSNYCLRPDTNAISHPRTAYGHRHGPRSFRLPHEPTLAHNTYPDQHTVPPRSPASANATGLEFDLPQVPPQSRRDARAELVSRFAARLSGEIRDGCHAKQILGSSGTRAEFRSNMRKLLRDYSLLLDIRAEPGIEHRSARFVRAQCDKIAADFSTIQDAKPSKSGGMSLAEKIGLFDLDQGPWIELAELPAAEKFLTTGPVYEWFVGRLQALSDMEYSTIDSPAHTVIRRTIVDFVNTLPRSRTNFVIIQLPWDPLEFRQTQYGALMVGFASVICVMGGSERAYATTCGGYVRSVWPMTGYKVISALDNYCKSARARQSISYWTWSTGSHWDLKLDFRVFDGAGGPTSVRIESAQVALLVEAVEVICWLATTCREGPGTSISCCSPRLVARTLVGCLKLQVLLMEAHDSGGNDRDEGASGPESSWHGIFYNAVAVRGYSIPRRANNEPGLEIDLALASVLAAARRATIVDGMLVLKGLCTMLVLAMCRGTTSSIWHFLRNDDLSWMPYSKAKQYATEDGSFDHLAATRHFIGWTYEGQCLAGTKHAAYDTVKYTGDDVVKPGIALDGVTLNVTKIVGAAVKFLPGKKDSWFLRSVAKPYERRVEILSAYEVVFYGKQDRRAWLLDGASALLHISRAALTHEKAPGVHKGFDINAFKHANPKRSAKDVLLDKHNRELELYERTRTDPAWCFEDLVDHYAEVLFEMRHHQQKLQSSEAKQWDVKNPFSRLLVGFGFVDIVSCQTAIPPRCVELYPSGAGWLRPLTRFGAINIIGSSFGTLMKSATDHPCRMLKYQVPVGYDVLAAPMSRLVSIAEQRGEVSNDSLQLFEDVVWNDPHLSFPTTPCGCGKHSEGGQCGKRISQLDDHRKKYYKGKREIQRDIFKDCPSALVILGVERASRGLGCDPLSAPLGANSHFADDSGVEMGSVMLG